jgi:hypothetical protein
MVTLVGPPAEQRLQWAIGDQSRRRAKPGVGGPPRAYLPCTACHDSSARSRPLWLARAQARWRARLRPTLPVRRRHTELSGGTPVDSRQVLSTGNWSSRPVMGPHRQCVTRPRPAPAGGERCSASRSRPPRPPATLRCRRRGSRPSGTATTRWWSGPSPILPRARRLWLDWGQPAAA